MKIKKGFVLRELAGEHIVSAEGLEQIDFTKLISLNPTAAYLWQQVEEKDFTEPMLTHLLIEAYEVDEATAQADVCQLVKRWKEAGLIED